MRVFRATYTCRAKPGAKRVERAGRVYLRWPARGGTVEGELLPDGRVRVVVTSHWWMEWTGPDGRTRRAKGYTDRAATEAECRRRQVAADRIRAGLEDPRDDGKGLHDHLDDYLDYLRSKGRQAAYIASCRHRVARVIDGTRAVSPSDLTEHAVTVFVAGLRAGRRGIGPTTAAAYVAAVKSFLAWMIRNRRTSVNPLSMLVPDRDDRDIRRRRRRLTDDEFARLLAAARASRPRKAGRHNARPYGIARAMLYIVAAYTGFRADELGSLTPASFRLHDSPPTVTVAAERSKRGTEDTIPIPTAVATRLRPFLDSRPPREPVWPGQWHERAAELIREDLAAAGIPYRDDRGRYADFHSLRRLYIDRVVRVADLKTAQRLARHASGTLTADVYAEQAEMARLAEAAERLPPPE